MICASGGRRFVSSATGHVLCLLILCFTIALVYAKVTKAYFCAYDDFTEIHRAAFEDSQNPSRVFTTSHVNSYKYRPAARGVTLFTYWLADANPLVFRTRNLAFHFVNVVLLYTLGWLLFRSILVSGVGAALFGLHPLANQSVIGAVWPSTINHAAFLLGVVLFVISTHSKERWGLWLIASLVSGWISLLAYESNITVYAMMCIYLAAAFLFRRERAIGWRFLLMFGVACGALLGPYFLVRQIVVPEGWHQIATELPTVEVVLKNAAMYLVALLAPIDAVLANEWWHTPLPSEMMVAHPMALLLGGCALLVGFAILITLWLANSESGRINWTAVSLSIAGILLPLLPMLAFKSHPSETYLYIPVAF
jgi:hypothetical protein